MEDILAKIKRIDLAPTQIKITLDELHPSATIIASLTFRKRGVERKLIIGEHAAEPDEHLTNTLAKANLWLSEIKAGKPIQGFLKEHKIKPEYFRRRLKLVFLSPKIQRVIIKGSQPDHLTLTYLVKFTDLPSDWRAQEKRLGIS